MLRVSITEDLKDYREALESLIRNTPGLQCEGVHERAEDALEHIPVLQPDVALVDINLPGMDGIELVRKISERSPNTLCMMCTAYDEDEKIFRALSAGAHGYILKSTPPSKIIDAIFELSNGGAPMSSEVARKVVTAFRKPGNENSKLTPREHEILGLLAKGLLYKEIGTQLGISLDTVKRHCFNIYEKLHVNNRTEAINKFRRFD
jgi:NarL family two-component system response regulator LiaR